MDEVKEFYVIAEDMKESSKMPKESSINIKLERKEEGTSITCVGEEITLREFEASLQSLAKAFYRTLKTEGSVGEARSYMFATFLEYVGEVTGGEWDNDDTKET